MTNVHIRWMIHDDLPAVVAIERLSFDQAWSHDEFVLFLGGMHRIGVVAEVGDADHGFTTVGFLLYELYQCRFDVVNFAVHPEWRRSGIAGQMLRPLAAKLDGSKCRINAVVRDSNLSAQLFFRSQGFRAVEILRGCYADDGDGYLFRLNAADLAFTPSAKRYQ